MSSKAHIWLLRLIPLTVLVSSTIGQNNEQSESLRGALNAVKRKQRSLQANPQDYYLDLPVTSSIDRLREAEKQRVDKFEARQRGGNGDGFNDDAVDDALAFIRSGTGQGGTINDGYQHLANRQNLERALLDYLQYGVDRQNERDNDDLSIPGVASRSVFRERERTGSSKRSANTVLTSRQDQSGDKTIGRIIQGQVLGNDDNGVSRNDAYGSNIRQLLDEQRERENERSTMMERRNVNARYPLYNGRDYDYYVPAAKRYPLSKRSAKASSSSNSVPVATKRQVVTDSKVAQDLGSLFGSGMLNNSHVHEHETVKIGNHPTMNNETSQLANNKTIKGRSIEVRKKSVDWSQYFGIDRRKKKTYYAAKPSTRDQDNEYLLQKYYEIMAEHLKPSGKIDGSSENKRNPEQLRKMDSELKTMKERMIDEAVKVSSSLNNEMAEDDQQVKDEIMSRLAAAYSLEKLRRALEELSSSTIQQQQRASGVFGEAGNLTSAMVADKRNQPRREDVAAINRGMKSCPQMMLAEVRCRANEAIAEYFREALHVPCIMYHVCSSCDDDNCLERFALEAERACQVAEYEDYEDEDAGNEESIRDELQLRDLPQRSRKRCVEDALTVTRPRLERPAAATMCRALQANQRCLVIYQEHKVQPYVYGIMEMSRDDNGAGNRLGRTFNR